MKLRPIHGALVVAVILIVIIGFGGETVKLTCTRSEPNEPVTCVKQTWLFWTIPLGTEEFHDVHRAYAHENPATGPENPNTTYDIHLDTQEGDVGLTSVSHLHAPPDAMVERINVFIRTPTNTNLEITDPGYLLGGGFWCLLSILPFIIAFYSVMLIQANTTRASE